MISQSHPFLLHRVVVDLQLELSVFDDGFIFLEKIWEVDGRLYLALYDVCPRVWSDRILKGGRDGSQFLRSTLMPWSPFPSPWIHNRHNDTFKLPENHNLLIKYIHRCRLWCSIFTTYFFFSSIDGSIAWLSILLERRHGTISVSGG